MNALASLFFTLLSSTLCAQTEVTVNWPLSEDYIYWYHSKRINHLERDSVNRILIKTSSCASRSLLIVADDNIAQIKENWWPIRVGAQLTDPLAEYTMATAERFGGIRQDEQGNPVEYVDISELYWEKGFDVTPSQADKLRLSLYCKMDRGLELVGSLELLVK